MNLVIDVGNTQYKICVFNKNELVHSAYFDEINQNIVDELLKVFPIESGIYSDTRNISKNGFLALFPETISFVELNSQTKLPIGINYETLNTLGKDRIAAAVGASVLFSSTPVLIIDIGTAITIDIIDVEGIFQGGVISPGPQTRFRSLSEFTGKLPLIEPDLKELALSGKSTNDAILFGVQNGILFEINEYILRYSKQYANLKVILTGGYAYLFDKKINYPIFAELFLVPKGLNRILDYNDN